MPRDIRPRRTPATFRAVAFPSQGAMLRGRLYLHEHMRRHPCVVMAHGTSATIGMVADQYAEALFASGLAVLLYDHFGFGQSGGEPRHEINPWVQARGYADAVAYLRANDRVDAGRIALWGDSYAGMLVLVSGALINGIAAVVSQIPACGTETVAVPCAATGFHRLKQTFERSDVTSDIVSRVGPLPVVSPDQINSPSLLKPVQAFRWFMEYGGRHGSGWENRVTRAIPRTEVPFWAGLAAPFLGAPTLMIAGRDDEMAHCNRTVQELIFRQIAATKDFFEVEGGHFGLLWAPGPIFKRAVERQIAFLHDWLKP